MPIPKRLFAVIGIVVLECMGWYRGGGGNSMSRCTLDGDPMEVESRCAAAPSHFRVDPVPALDRSNGRAHSQRHATVQTRRAIEASGFDHARERKLLGS